MWIRGGWHKNQYRSDSVLVWERLIQCLLVLKMEESQEARKAVIFRSWKRQEKGFSVRVKEGVEPSQYLGFSPVKLISDP